MLYGRGCCRRRGICRRKCDKYCMGGGVGEEVMSVVWEGVLLEKW